MPQRTHQRRPYTGAAARFPPPRESAASAAAGAAQINEARLKGSPFVDLSSVSIESMTSVGKDALVDQLVVKVKFGNGAKGEKK